MTRLTLVMVLVVALPVNAVAQDVAAPRRNDGVLDGVGRGAAVGALAALPMALAQMGSCDTGCDWASTPALLVGWAMLGAMAGSAIGLAADLDAPARLSPRAGAAFRTTSMRGGLSETSVTPALSVSVQLSRHISVHAEYASVGKRFPAAPGSVPDDILNNLVTEVPSSRPAGWRRGIESRRVDFIATQLVGVHLSASPRVRLELLGGLGVQGEEERAYYDAYRTVSGSITEQLPGKYYVLDFESPELGAVFGVDAEVRLARGLVVAPTFRYHAFDGSSASLAYGAGIYWRF